MFKFLFIMFFFFILLVFLMGFSILRTFKNMLFGSNHKGKKEAGQRRQTDSYASESRGGSRSGQDHARSGSRKKIFAKDEGEYVDYEEVK